MSLKVSGVKPVYPRKPTPLHKKKKATKIPSSLFYSSKVLKVKKWRYIPKQKQHQTAWKAAAVATSVILLPTGLTLSLATLSILPIPIIGQVVPLPAIALTQSCAVFIPAEMLKGFENGSLRKQGLKGFVEAGWKNMEVQDKKSYFEALGRGLKKGILGGAFTVLTSGTPIPKNTYVLRPIENQASKYIFSSTKRACKKQTIATKPQKLK